MNSVAGGLVVQAIADRAGTHRQCDTDKHRHRPMRMCGAPVCSLLLTPDCRKIAQLALAVRSSACHAVR